MQDIGFLFDLDGVLIDSEREYSRIWTEIERLHPTGIDNFASKIKGQTLSKILGDNYPDEKEREEVKRLLHHMEGEMKYTYCPGAEGFLNTLNSKGCRMAVVTSSDEVKMVHLYADIPDFSKKMDCIVDASLVKRSKPDPEGYLIGADLLKIPINRCVVFEDSVQGVKAGKNSGAFVVGVVGTKSREELSPYADILVESLDEIDLDKLHKTVSSR